MLNRTNRKNSANLLGLNLGTRSLAVNASVINGGLTLRTAHVGVDTPVVVDQRAGFGGYPRILVQGSFMGASKPEKPEMPAMSGSSPAMPEPSQGSGIRGSQEQPTILALASRPVSPSVERSTDARIRRDLNPRDPSPHRRPGTSPGWLCGDRYRARARAEEAALRSEATT